jgi:hypothetical protein
MKCPLPLPSDLVMVEAFRLWGLVVLFLEHGGGAEQMRLPKVKGRVVQTVVDNVADEIFCWLPTMSSSAEAFRCYEFPSPTLDVFGETFEQRDALGFHNEHSDERLKLKQQEHTIRNSRKQARLCPMLREDE